MLPPNNQSNDKIPKEQNSLHNAPEDSKAQNSTSHVRSEIMLPPNNQSNDKIPKEQNSLHSAPEDSKAQNSTSHVRSERMLPPNNQIKDEIANEQNPLRGTLEDSKDQKDGIPTDICVNSVSPADENCVKWRLSNAIRTATAPANGINGNKSQIVADQKILNNVPLCGVETKFPIELKSSISNRPAAPSAALKATAKRYSYRMSKVAAKSPGDWGILPIQEFHGSQALHIPPKVKLRNSFSENMYRKDASKASKGKLSVPCIRGLTLLNQKKSAKIEEKTDEENKLQIENITHEINDVTEDTLGENQAVICSTFEPMEVNAACDDVPNQPMDLDE